MKLLLFYYSTCLSNIYVPILTEWHILFITHLLYNVKIWGAFIAKIELYPDCFPNTYANSCQSNQHVYAMKTAIFTYLIIDSLMFPIFLQKFLCGIIALKFTSRLYLSFSWSKYGVLLLGATSRTQSNFYTTPSQGDKVKIATFT